MKASLTIKNNHDFDTILWNFFYTLYKSKLSNRLVIPEDFMLFSIS